MGKNNQDFWPQNVAYLLLFMWFAKQLQKNISKAATLQKHWGRSSWFRTNQSIKQADISYVQTSILLFILKITDMQI